MAIKELFLSLKSSYWLAVIRKILFELSSGLLVSWLILFLLEVARPGAVSLYIDLNGLLVAGLMMWLVGVKAESQGVGTQKR